MSGKVGSAIAAVALSSASVSAVGIVYTGVISVRYEFSGASNRIEGFGRAAPSPSVTRGPMVRTSSSNVESQSPPCLTDAGPGGCVVVFLSPDLKLSFFGYTVSIPAEWYSWGDDIYRAGEPPQFFGLVANLEQIVKSAAPEVAGQQQQAGSAPAAQDYGPNTVNDREAFASEIHPMNAFPIQLAANSINPNDAVNEPPSDATSSETGTSPIASVSTGSGSTIPEPSTWSMILAGCAALGFVRWRRARGRGAPTAVRRLV